MSSGQDSPFIIGKTGPSTTHEPKFKPYFPQKSKVQTEDKNN